MSNKLREALKELITDIRSKPNDTRYLIAINKAEAALAEPDGWVKAEYAKPGIKYFINVKGEGVYDSFTFWFIPVGHEGNAQAFFRSTVQRVTIDAAEVDMVHTIPAPPNQ